MNLFIQSFLNVNIIFSSKPSLSANA